MVVAPSGAGVKGERKFGEGVEPILGSERDGIRARLGEIVDHRLLQRRLRRHHAETRCVGQEVSDRDRPVRGLGVGQRRVGRAQDKSVGELGKPPLDRVAQVDQAVLDEPEGCDGENRLGHRLNPEEGVLLHVASSGELERVTCSAGDGEDARCRALRDVPVENFCERVDHASSKAPNALLVNRSGYACRARSEM